MFKKKLIHEYVNDGLILEHPKPEDYVFGGETQVGAQSVLAPDGQWKSFLPLEERQQKRYVETMGCVSFSALNALEMLIKAKYHLDDNRSDRFTAKMSGTTRSGNGFTKVGDSIRKDGTVKEEIYPFPEEIKTWEEFYADVPSGIKSLGQQFLNEYNIQYEWVPFNIGAVKEALKYAPLQVAVQAWFQRPNGLFYSPDGMTHNHATLLIGYKEGEYWEVFDSYDPFIKRLEWNFGFYGYALKYNIAKRTGNTEAEKLYNRFLNKVIWLVQAKGELVRLLPDKLKNIPVFVGDEELLLGYGQYLTDKKKVTPVSNEMYETIKSYYQSTYGSVQVEQGEPLGMEEIMKKL